MAIIGKTFNFQSVTAGDDGALYRMLAGRMNILSAIAGGNPFSISNNVITIAQSYLLVYGRFMRIAGGTTISLGTIPSSHVQGRVIIRLDMSKLATETTLGQIETEVETIASGSSYRALVTNQDINSISGQNTSKYEAVLCTFTCSSGTASNPVSALPTSLSYPLSIANGGTGATAKGNAFLNISAMEYATATDFNNIRLPGVYAINPSTTSTNHPTGANDYGQLIVIGANQNYTGEWSMTLQIFTKLFGDGIYVRSYANQSWKPWHQVYVTPQITKITFNGNASAGALQNLQIQSAEVLSGSSFVDTTTSAWNYYVPVGTYRITLQAQFPTGSASDYYGIMAGRDATPNYSLACQFGCGLPVVQRLNASGIMVNTNSSEAHSLIVRSNKALTDCSGFLTIEKLS